MLDKNWLKSLGMAMSLPSTILFSAILCKKLVDHEVMTWGYASVIFVSMISSTIFLMVYYSYKNKK